MRQPGVLVVWATVTHQRSSSGFSLIELLITITVLLLLMATIYPILRSSSLLGRVQTDRTEPEMTTLRALDDMTIEIARAGYGLGRDVERICAGLPGQAPGSDSITVRSNPEGVANRLRTNLSAELSTAEIVGQADYQPGEWVLLTGERRKLERAVVTSVEPGRLSVRSLDGPAGRLQNAFWPSRGGRVLKSREVRFWLRRSDDEAGAVLFKQVNDGPARVLARDVAELQFEYLDAAGEVIAPPSAKRAADLALVRVHLRLRAPPRAVDPNLVSPLTETVALESQSSTVPFDPLRHGFRLLRFFWPMSNVTGVVSRPFAETGVMLSSGPPGETGLGFLYIFLLQNSCSTPRSASTSGSSAVSIPDFRRDAVFPLADVRDPLIPVFAPEESVAAGSLFVVSGTLRDVQIWRVFPEPNGSIGPHSQLRLDASARELWSAGGAAFGIDGALYVSDPAQRCLWRYHPQPEASLGTSVFERVGDVEGEPGSMVAAESGLLYFLVRDPSRSGRGALWKLPFDDALTPQSPREVSVLRGEPRSLTLDPVSGSLFALVQEGLDDSVLYELPTVWLRHPTSQPREAFRLSRWKQESQRIESALESLVLPPTLEPTTISFAAFDTDGALYLGTMVSGVGKFRPAPAETTAGTRLVLKCEIDRPDGTASYRAGVAAVAGQDKDSPRKHLRLNAWKKTTAGP